MVHTYLQTIKEKQRIVFAGSSGCKAMAMMVAHVLESQRKPFDLVIHHEVVRQQEASPLALIVADDSAGSNGEAIFLGYDHHVGVITEIQYKDQTGFTGEDEYIRQFDQFADSTPKGGLLAFCEQDPVASVLCNKERPDVGYIPFKAHAHVEENGNNFLVTSHKDRVKVNLYDRSDWRWFGGAKELLKKIGVTSEQFYQSILGYRGS